MPGVPCRHRTRQRPRCRHSFIIPKEQSASTVPVAVTVSPIESFGHSNSYTLPRRNHPICPRHGVGAAVVTDLVEVNLAEDRFRLRGESSVARRAIGAAVEKILPVAPLRIAGEEKSLSMKRK